MKRPRSHVVAEETPTSQGSLLEAPEPTNVVDILFGKDYDELVILEKEADQAEKLVEQLTDTVELLQEQLAGCLSIVADAIQEISDSAPNDSLFRIRMAHFVRALGREMRKSPESNDPLNTQTLVHLAIINAPRVA